MKSSPPLQLHVDPLAKPVVVHVPAIVPLQLGVKEGLDRDCRLGVIEQVPMNTPTTWLHRMVVTAKHDGSPRRTIDYTFDCWHGYHSLLLGEEDREFTTFVTPWGRYRYLTQPQGVLLAGDGYTHRLDKILEEFDRLKRCIDDNLLWDNTVEEPFFRCCQFLDTCVLSSTLANFSLLLNKSPSWDLRER